MLAVRTNTSKLIKYPGHDEWTEVFDLKNDPFELKNLVDDTALLKKTAGGVRCRGRGGQIPHAEAAERRQGG